MHNLNNSALPQRDAYWDNLKGILIFFVVMGHFLMIYPSLKLAVYGIYLFHMPAFLFISGYFSRRTSLQKNKFIRLIIILACFNLVLMVGEGGKNPQNWTFYAVHLSAWYILALILYRLTIPLLYCISPIKSLFLSLAIGLCMGLVPSRDAFCLYKIIALYPFFAAGFIWRNSFNLAKPRNFNKLIAFFTLIATLISGILFVRLNWLSFGHLLWFPYQTAKEGVVRLYLYAAGFTCILCLLSLMPTRRLPIITNWGANSLVIFILHRPIAQICQRVFPPDLSHTFHFITLLLIALSSIIISNTKFVSNTFNKVLDKLVHICIRPNLSTTGLIIMIGLLIVAFTSYACNSKTPTSLSVLTTSQKEELSQCFRISYIGDLVFLSPQIHRAYNKENNSYDFLAPFEYTKDIFKHDDLTIAVLEGPVANSNIYSLTNCLDYKPIRLNYPSSLLDSLKNVGIDFVTTATNHMLDHYHKGALETVQNLNAKGLPFVGTCTDPSKPRHKIINLKREDGSALRLAVLAYTYGSNYVDESDFFRAPLNDMVSCIVAPDSAHYEQSLAQVKRDIERAKSDKPDCLIVMPHMGEQFQHEPDKFQKHWCHVFSELGADIILADHPHATQPIEWIENISHRTLTVYCPGNYANSYTRSDGDGVSIVEIYIDKKKGTPVACSVIPMWVSAHGVHGGGQYIPVPIAEIARGKIDIPYSNLDWERLHQINPIITGSMLRAPLPLHAASFRYFKFPDKPGHVFRDSRENKLPVTETIQSSPLYQACINSEHICFVGDSITEGTMNNGYGWYEPLTAILPQNTKISSFAKGSMTSKFFLTNALEIGKLNADLYIMAYGTNDIRYRDSNVCAMTPKQYIENISETINTIRKINPSASFAFIAPWYSYIYDKNCKLNDLEKDKMITAYSEALQDYCREHGHIFANPNPILKEKFHIYHATYPYWVDDIHPNGTSGTLLYSKAALEGSY